MVRKPIWLDCDPGHDDAMAICLAIHCDNIELLGVSTTHGNASHNHTTINAARCLLAFGAEKHVHVYPGASKPLLREARHDPEIHGPDGLGGVEGLPAGDDPEVLALFARQDGKIIRALEGMSQMIRKTWNEGAGAKVTVISTGPMTNIALFISVYPEVVETAVEQFVFMGGGVGLGNRSAVAEYNIMCDPHAAQIVLDAPVPAVMVPINVTHTAIVTRQLRWRLLSPTQPMDQDISVPPPKARTNLRHTLFTLINFFAETYDSTFGFKDGPPLHDALTLAYVSAPQLFKTKRYRVDVELTGTHCLGETVVDVWNYRNCDDGWGPNGKNCLVAEALDVDGFFELFFQCVEECDKTSPLNKLEHQD